MICVGARSSGAGVRFLIALYDVGDRGLASRVDRVVMRLTASILIEWLYESEQRHGGDLRARIRMFSLGSANTPRIQYS